jgi:hypothetical protein
MSNVHQYHVNNTEERFEEDVYVTQLLLQELLPVFGAVESHLTDGHMPAAPATTTSAQTPAGRQQQGAQQQGHQGWEQHQGQQQQQEEQAQTSLPPVDQDHHPQGPAAAPSVDSLLLLLLSGAHTLHAAFAMGLGSSNCVWPARDASAFAPPGAPRPAVPASTFDRSSLNDPSQVEQCLASVLRLAHGLTVDSPWWQEAKAKQPLLLIEAVFMTSQVRTYPIQYLLLVICTTLGCDEVAHCGLGTTGLLIRDSR